MLSRDKIKLKFQKTPPLLSGQSDSDDFLESVVHIIDNGESQEEVNSLPSDASSNQQASFMRLHSSEEKNNLSNHYDEGMQVHAQVSSSIAQVEVSGVQQESFLVFAEQQYLREHVELREIFAKYGREYQEILLSASNGDEEVKMERPSPRVFFSYAWPILSMFPHEWWHQLFLVSLREDLRELFGIDAYVDIMDSIDNPVRYMIENFSSDSFEVQETRDQTTSPVSMVSFFYGVICFFYQFFSTLLIFLRSYLTEGLLFSSANVLNSFSQESFDAQADDRHRTAINNQQSNKLICMVGSQSFVRKCTNDRFVGSMVRYEKVFIQSCISRFTNSGLPLEQMPVMALSLGNYQDCILPNFQGSTNAYESHRYSYYQFLQAILYKLFLCTSGTAEQNNECKELLNRMRCDPILGSVFERRGQEFKYYYRDTHLFQDVQVLRNKYNLPHWLNGELENVLKIWRSMISKESLDLVSALSSNAQSNSFLDFMDSSSIMMNDFALIKDALAKRYLEASKIRLFEQERPVPLEKQYVNLVIVKEQEQRSKDNAMKNAKRDATEKLVEHHDGLHDENEGLLSKDEVKEEVGDNYDEGLHIKNPGRDLVPGIMKHYEDIHTPKEEIDVENIFKGSNLASEQKILKKVELLGRAGVGKTTLSYYLTYRWALGLLWQNELEWIFHFSLKKMMSNYDRTHIYSMSDVLFKEYLHSVPGFTLEKANEFWKFVLKNPSKVLFVLDGYDEVVLDDHPVIEMLLQEAPRFLVTSRPYARIKQKADLVLENIGFTEKNIKTYITRYFIRCDEESQSVNKPLAESDEDHPLWEWLENHETVKMMCKIPINAELICQLWLDDAPLFQDAHVSVGDLYRSIFNKLIKRYLAKQPEFEREINQMPDQLWLNSSKALNVKAFLKRVAFQGIKNNILIIDYTVIKEVLAAHPDLCKENDILLQLAQSGLLKSINDDVILSKQSFYFIHYSFQEYLAGCYIADTIEHRETQDFIRKNKFYPAYQWVMVYAASSMKNQIDRLDCFYDVLLSPPRDLYGQRELELLLRCGEAACWPREWKGRTPLLEKIMDFLFQDGESFESLNFIPRYIVSDCFQAFLELKDQDGNQGVFEILKARNAHDPHAVLLGISDLTYDIVLTDSEVDQVLRWVEELIEQDDMDAIKWFFQEIITYVTLNQSQVERTLKIIESIIEKSDYPSEIIVKDLDEENVFSYLSFDEAQWSRLFDALENKLSSIGFQEMLTFLQGLELSDFQMDRVIVWFENFFVDWVGKNRFIQCCKKSSELRDFSEAMSEFFSCIELTSLQLDRLLNVFDACLFFETQALMVGFLSGVEFNAMQVDRVIGWIEAGWRRADSFWFDSTSEFFKSIELTSTQLDRLLDIFEEHFSINMLEIILDFLSDVKLNDVHVDRVIGWIETGWRMGDSLWHDSTSKFFKSIELTSTQLDRLLDIFEEHLSINMLEIILDFLSDVKLNDVHVDRVIVWIEDILSEGCVLSRNSAKKFFKNVVLKDAQIEKFLCVMSETDILCRVRTEKSMKLTNIQFDFLSDLKNIENLHGKESAFISTVSRFVAQIIIAEVALTFPQRNLILNWIYSGLHSQENNIQANALIVLSEISISSAQIEMILDGCESLLRENREEFILDLLCSTLKTLSLNESQADRVLSWWDDLGLETKYPRFFDMVDAALSVWALNSSQIEELSSRLRWSFDAAVQRCCQLDIMGDSIAARTECHRVAVRVLVRYTVSLLSCEKEQEAIESMDLRNSEPLSSYLDSLKRKIDALGRKAVEESEPGVSDTLMSLFYKHTAILTSLKVDYFTKISELLNCSSIRDRLGEMIASVLKLFNEQSASCRADITTLLFNLPLGDVEVNIVLQWFVDELFSGNADVVDFFVPSLGSYELNSNQIKKVLLTIELILKEEIDLPRNIAERLLRIVCLNFRDSWRGWFVANVLEINQQRDRFLLSWIEESLNQNKSDNLGEDALENTLFFFVDNFHEDDEWLPLSGHYRESVVKFNSALHVFLERYPLTHEAKLHLVKNHEDFLKIYLAKSNSFTLNFVLLLILECRTLEDLEKSVVDNVFERLLNLSCWEAAWRENDIFHIDYGYSRILSFVCADPDAFEREVIKRRPQNALLLELDDYVQVSEVSQTLWSAVSFGEFDEEDEVKLQNSTNKIG